MLLRDEKLPRRVIKLAEFICLVSVELKGTSDKCDLKTDSRRVEPSTSVSGMKEILHHLQQDPEIYYCCSSHRILESESHEPKVSAD